MGMKVNGTSGLTFPDTTTLASAGQASVRAWVNFNGTGTVAIRAAYNVTSITDNGTGDYTVNFTTALPDANYAVCTNASASSGFDVASYESVSTTRTASLVRTFFHNGGGAIDPAFCSVAVFR
jgi:hypothetical protein